VAVIDEKVEFDPDEPFPAFGTPAAPPPPIVIE
jgi:hypothetical protein